MDLPITISIIAASVGAVGLTIRRFFLFLERWSDRRLARYMFDQTRSTDAMNGYAKLCEAQHTVVVPTQVLKAPPELSNSGPEAS